jgi:hypothetical protein
MTRTDDNGLFWSRRQRDWFETKSFKLLHAPAGDIETALREADTRARLAERQAIEAMLREPDEAMVEAACRKLASTAGHGEAWPNFRVVATMALAAIADVLFPPSKEA